jgi:hypothetical protein
MAINRMCMKGLFLIKCCDVRPLVFLISEGPGSHRFHLALLPLLPLITGITRRDLSVSSEESCHSLLRECLERHPEIPELVGGALEVVQLGLHQSTAKVSFS